MRIDVTDDPAAFRARDWTPLVGADPEGSFFHTPHFLETYWEEFGPGGALRIVFVEDGGETVAACAFEIRDGLLAFLGGFDVTDYMGPVGNPGVEEPAAKELAGAVVAMDGWDRADLAGLPEEGRWLALLERALQGAGLSVELAEDGVTPLLDLAGSGDAYEAWLPQKLRHELRRKRRRLEREAGGFELVPTTPATLAEHLDRFIALHRSSRGSKGKFMHSGMEMFFRHLAEDSLGPGWFRLTFLRTKGELAAGAISFRYKDTVMLYNSAFDHALAPLAPGMVLVGELIRQAADEGVARFDLLKGDLGYKYRFGARPRRVCRLKLSR